MKICGISCFCNIFHLVCVCVCVACQSEFHHTKGISTTQHHTATLTDKDAGETAQSLSPQKKTLRQGKGGLGRAKRALANKIYVHRLLLSKQKVRRAAHIHTHTHTHIYSSNIETYEQTHLFQELKRERRKTLYLDPFMAAAPNDIVRALE